MRGWREAGGCWEAIAGEAGEEKEQGAVSSLAVGRREAPGGIAGIASTKGIP